MPGCQNTYSAPLEPQPCPQSVTYLAGFALSPAALRGPGPQVRDGISSEHRQIRLSYASSTPDVDRDLGVSVLCPLLPLQTASSPGPGSLALRSWNTRHVVCARRPGAAGLPGSGMPSCGMAVLFELVVNFGTDMKAAEAAAEHVDRAGHIDVRGVHVPLPGPFVTGLGSPDYIEFTVVPSGIGWGPHLKPPAFDPRSLTSDEITQIGHTLYALLRAFTGYRAAIVGWNPESLVDLEDLETDWRNGDPQATTAWCSQTTCARGGGVGAAVAARRSTRSSDGEPAGLGSVLSASLWADTAPSNAGSGEGRGW
jgi:hypothetical protein